MQLSDLNFYIYGLYALIGSVIFAVVIVLYLFKVDKVAGISNSLFRTYFLMGVIGWGGNILRDAGILNVDLQYSATAYITVTCILLLSLFESFRRVKSAFYLILIHIIFIILLFLFPEYFKLFITFSIYGLIFYSIIFVGLAKMASQTKNVGYAFIAFASLIICVTSILQIYIVVIKQNYEIAYGLSVTQSAIGFALVGLGYMTILLFDKQKQLTALALNDPLTGLLNRRGMDYKISVTLTSSERLNKCISAIAIDIDFFKKINDTYGHDAGDMVLIKIAELVANQARASDVTCRFGGEEFVVILPDTENKLALSIAERIRKNIENLNIHYEDAIVSLTSSFGVSTHCGKIDMDYLLKDADKALYSAKASGRNKVCNASN